MCITTEEVMNTRLSLPRATLYVSSRYIYFRFDSVPARLFYRYLHFVRQRFPYMQWAEDFGMWQLAICDLQPLYELCRLLFGANNVQFQYRQYMDGPRIVQLSLFDSKEA